jgi:hypothetical protein
MVDESACNGTTDYVSETTVGERDSYRVSLASVPVTGFDPTVGFILLLNAFLAFGAAMGAYVFVTFSHQYKRATDRSFTNTHVFTPLHALFSQERRSLHSRIILWKWLAVVLAITFVAVLFLIR